MPRVFLSRPQRRTHLSVSTLFLNFFTSIIFDIWHVNPSSPSCFTVFSSTHLFPHHETANAHMFIPRSSHFIFFMLLVFLVSPASTLFFFFSIVSGFPNYKIISYFYKTCGYYTRNVILRSHYKWNKIGNGLRRFLFDKLRSIECHGHKKRYFGSII